MKKLILLFISLAFTANAANITLLPPQPEGIFAKVLRCNIHISCYREKLGTTITTINATDLISASRAVINTNFTNLNNAKIESATSSMASVTTLANLVTVGTIVTGTWNASTLTVSYGGTGSTTLSANQVLLGNGTGNIGVVTGYGTSGQFLTSNGSGSAPTWTSASFDITTSYNPLSGNWNFTGTTRVKNLNASSTASNPIVLNGVSYDTPSAQGASSTVFINNGSGNLFNGFPGVTLLFASTTASATTTFRTGTLLTGNFSTLIVEVYDPGSTSRQLSLTFNGDGDDKVSGSPKGNYSFSGSSIISGAFPANSVAFSPNLGIEPSATTSPAFIRVIINNPSSSRKFVTWDSTYVSASTTDIGWRVSGGGQWANSSSQITSILLRDFTPVANGVDANTTFKVWGINSI